jgi:hypothetical protein
MTTIEDIQEHVDRPYKDGDQWAGTGFSSRDGTSEGGLQAHLYEHYFTNEANVSKNGEVLDPNREQVLSLEQRDMFKRDLDDLLSKISSSSDPKEKRSLKSAYKDGQSILAVDSERVAKYNAQAMVVIGIIKKTSTATVGNLFKPLEMQHGGNAYKVLDGFLAIFRARFYGRMSDVRAQEWQGSGIKP